MGWDQPAELLDPARGWVDSTVWAQGALPSHVPGLGGGEMCCFAIVEVGETAAGRRGGSS